MAFFLASVKQILIKFYGMIESDPGLSIHKRIQSSGIRIREFLRFLTKLLLKSWTEL